MSSGAEVAVVAVPIAAVAGAAALTVAAGCVAVAGAATYLTVRGGVAVGKGVLAIGSGLCMAAADVVQAQNRLHLQRRTHDIERSKTQMRLETLDDEQRARAFAETKAFFERAGQSAQLKRSSGQQGPATVVLDLETLRHLRNQAGPTESPQHNPGRHSARRAHANFDDVRRLLEEFESQLNRFESQSELQAMLNIAPHRDARDHARARMQVLERLINTDTELDAAGLVARSASLSQVRDSLLRATQAFMHEVDQAAILTADRDATQHAIENALTELGRIGNTGTSAALAELEFARTLVEGAMADLTAGRFGQARVAADVATRHVKNVAATASNARENNIRARIAELKSSLREIGDATELAPEASYWSGRLESCEQLLAIKQLDASWDILDEVNQGVIEMRNMAIRMLLARSNDHIAGSAEAVLVEMGYAVSRVTSPETGDVYVAGSKATGEQLRVAIGGSQKLDLRDAPSVRAGRAGKIALKTEGFRGNTCKVEMARFVTMMKTQHKIAAEWHESFTATLVAQLLEPVIAKVFGNAHVTVEETAEGVLLKAQGTGAPSNTPPLLIDWDGNLVQAQKIEELVKNDVNAAAAMQRARNRIRESRLAQ